VSPRVLPRRFFERSAPEVARDLLGAVVVSRMGGRIASGIIVETEAYLGCDDPASHAYLGRRHRQNQGIYSRPGSWYVYRSYGIHWCANLVTGPAERGAAVLLRAILPRDGRTVMARRRGRRADDPALGDGPGKLCQALGIDRDLDGLVMSGSLVQVMRGVTVPEDQVTVTPRVGITRAADWPLRFVSTLRP